MGASTNLQFLILESVIFMKTCYEVYVKTRHYGRGITICITSDKDFADVILHKTNTMLKCLANYFYLKDRHKTYTLDNKKEIFCVSAVDYLFQKAEASTENLNVNSKEEFVRKYICFKKLAFIRPVKVLNGKVEILDEIDKLDFKGEDQNAG